MQEAGSGKQEAINIQTVQLVLFCDLILEWDFVNFHQDCRVHVKISCTLCYSCTKTRNQYRHVQKFCSGSYYMNTGIWNHWTEFCTLVHTICKQVFVSWKFLKWAGIGLLQKCMQCKNVQIGLGKSEREWTALFYINWTNKLWKNENIYYRHSEHTVCSFTMPGKNRSSPWWNHFQIVDGDFRVVQCILCNKMVRRGKAGCSSKETSNSGMATHMRSREAIL